jgi:uncharacterized protein (UPF0332 family)
LIDEARHHLRRSQKLLAMVKARAEIELPEVVAHTAYYSMHHAAVAVLIAHGVAIPKTHRGLIARLGQLDRDDAWQARSQVALLTRALDRRLIADYEAEDTLTIEHAKSARDDAVTFIAFCEGMVNSKKA